ncbi:indolepyruvate oxidoreductase subunit beta family protein [Zeimonas arvi]|uniref:Indolepyruvate oxidoreductase subunit beta family protein n=1 Tax=Zeimonas arvi TaxID=2498847 RepID=A0A5C8NSF2_9BURK|nr:indolepyruvate oxidoreductase subunit beta family protein [Zeimonas arvi]TXL63785.1 indolepyruvate oxidoreductase subunit beta family protein [Zeimonas arvi]
MSASVSSSVPAAGDAPFCILIAALGGEGGGVLADWIVGCALAQGLPVQATSVPGVAQRTGATSYYIETLRAPAAPGSQPVFALNPMPGRVDVVLASELLESARMIERGFVSPARTTLIAARHRVYTTAEKMQMGDGRFHDARIHEAAAQFARRYLSLDMEGIATRHGTVISAVMFGALAGSGLLPWSRAVCEEAIRRGGLGVDASLAGFGAAFDAAAGATIESALAETPAAARAAPEVWAPLIATLPESMHAFAAHGVARLIDWQDAPWAREYVDRLVALAAAAPAESAAARDSLAEAARQLALWMSYEDAIRVADLKTRPERFARIRAEAQAGDDDIVRIVDYLKPGSEEIAQILPRALGKRLRARASRGGGLPLLGRGLHMSTSHVRGYLALRLLAALRPLRRRSLRFHEEREAMGRWLDALGKALPDAPELALQIAGLPRLLKGYGDTWARGRASYDRIFATLVSPAMAEPAAGRDVRDRVGQIRDAVSAALADPEGRRLEDTLARAGIEPLPPRSKPIVWMRKPRSGPGDGKREIGENPGTAP